MKNQLVGAVAAFTIVFAARLAESQTVTVTIAGVVVDQDNLRLGDIRVRLYGGAELRTDLSRGNGVYNLTVSGIDDQTRKLLVRYKDSAYDEAAIIVDLDDAMESIRRCKAQDLQLFSRNALSTTQKEAAARLASAISTETAKVEFKLTDEVNARQSLINKYAQIVAALPAAERPKLQGVVDMAWQIEPFAKAPVNVQEFKALPESSGFQERVLAEQRRLDATRREIPGLFDEARLDSEKLDKVLSIPATNIPMEWLFGQHMNARLPVIARNYQQPLKKDVFDLSPDGSTIQVAPLAQGNDLKRCLLLYEGLKLNPALEPEQKERIEARIQQLIPLVDRAK
jgi:hypothetical protein